MPKNRNLPFTLILFALMAGAIILLYLQNKALKSESIELATYVRKQEQVIDSLRRRDMANMISNVFEKVDDELNSSSQRRLSDERIASIVALCFFFKPYSVFVDDSLPDQKLSPERGQILLLLTKLNIDSGSLHRIIAQADFSSADLRGADLTNADLSGAKLEAANLQGAFLQNANLTNANLMYANLWGANMNHATLHGTNFKRAILKWAKLDNTDLSNANLNGVDLSAALLRNTDWQGATMIWANANGTLLNHANLEGVDLIGTDFTMANLSSSILCNANMIRGNLTETNLYNSDFTGTELKLVRISEENWLSKLDDWQVSSAQEIQNKYIVVHERSNVRSPYQLEKIEEVEAKKKN